MESDEGTFTPHGLSFSGSPTAGCILQEILKLTAGINTTHYETPQVLISLSAQTIEQHIRLKFSFHSRLQDGGPDISLWTSKGVPGASLINSNERYFWFHHSAGDMMSVEDPRALDLCTALWAVSSFIVADLSFTMPRS
jgi:carboxypeptidase Q